MTCVNKKDNKLIKKIVGGVESKYNEIIKQKEQSLLVHVALLDKMRKENIQLKIMCKKLQNKIEEYEKVLRY